MIGKYIFSTLSGVSGITALVEAGGVTRIYPLAAPLQTATPYMTYRVISITPKDHSKNEPALDDQYQVDFQFFESPEKPNEALENIETLHELTRLALDRVAATAGGVEVKHAEFTGCRPDSIEPTTNLIFRTASYTFRVVR